MWLGCDILKEKNRFKVREGFNPEIPKIPEKIYETPSAKDVISEVAIRKAIILFFKELGE